MPKHKKPSQHGDKKAAVLQNRKSKKNPLVFIAAAVVVGAVGLALFVINQTALPVNSPSSANTVNGQVTYPVSMFEDGTARHFDHQADGFNIRYFIIKSADGIIRAAFDACDVCWPAGKGYYQEGNYMICRNCGRKFASELVNEVKGGCNPAPLERRIEGDRLVLNVEDILSGKSYFNLKGKV